MFEITNKARQNRIRKLADAFKMLEVSEVITRAQLNKVSGQNLCKPDILYAAMRLANSEDGTYLESRRNVGYVKLPPQEWEGEAIRRQRRARKQASMGRKTISNIIKFTNELSDEEQRRASRTIGLMQTIEALTRRSAHME